MTPDVDAAKRTTIFGLPILKQLAMLTNQPVEMALEREVPHGHYASIADWGASGGRNLGDAAAIQAAFDQAPIGIDLHFPPGEYLINKPLTLRRQLNLIGNGAYLVANFLDDDLLRVNIEDALNRDSRNQRISGLRLFVPKGNGNCLRVSNQKPNIANIGLVIDRNILSSSDEGQGYALLLEGIGTHHVVVSQNQIENGIKVHTADGITIEECLIFGLKTGIVIDVIEGAFLTRVIKNAIVSRDGAIKVLNGSQIYIEMNTFEQFPRYGENKSTDNSHIVIDPKSYRSSHIYIRKNNFGGGDNVGCSIKARGPCTNINIDCNVFNVNRKGLDVFLSSPEVMWTKIGPNNTTRGQRRRTAHLTSGDVLVVIDRGVGSFGVENSLFIEASGSWKAEGQLSLKKSIEGQVYLFGAITGTGRTGSLIGNVPFGMRPLYDTIVSIFTERGTAVPLKVEKNGNMRLLSEVTGKLNLGGICFWAAPPPIDGYE